MVPYFTPDSPPADGATGVDTSTELVWTPVAGGIHVVLLGGAANDPTYFIASGGTRVRIPDLSARGLGLPSARPYDFLLFGIDYDLNTQRRVHPAYLWGGSLLVVSLPLQMML